MTRILVVGLVIALFVGASVFYLFIFKPQNEPPIVNPQTLQASPSPSLTTNTTLLASASALQNQVSSLEATVADLQRQINVNKAATSQNTNTLKAPLYIPLGSGAASSSLTWETSDALQVTIDPALYPGYSSMVLEMGLQVYQGNGQAFARLYDVTDSQPVSNSDVSSTDQNYLWVTSSGFRLAAGSKTYKLQLYTNTTYTASEQNARIRVNF